MEVTSKLMTMQKGLISEGYYKQIKWEKKG